MDNGYSSLFASFKVTQGSTAPQNLRLHNPYRRTQAAMASSEFLPSANQSSSFVEERRRLVGRDRQFGCSVEIGNSSNEIAAPNFDFMDEELDCDLDELLSESIGLSKRPKAD